MLLQLTIILSPGYSGRILLNVPDLSATALAAIFNAVMLVVIFSRQQVLLCWRLKIITSSKTLKMAAEVVAERSGTFTRRTRPEHPEDNIVEERRESFNVMGM